MLTTRARRWAGSTGLALPLLLAACAQTPMGPTVQVMPGQGKPFDQFQTDQVVCKQFAEQSVSGQAHNANMRGLGAAALTTVLGAGLGAAIGGGHGAAIGAAGGALGGAGIGAATSSKSQNSIQDQYNNAYAQCMYSKGNQVPGYAPAPAAYAPPPPPASHGSLTQAVQIQLIRLGYLQGPADGVLGPQTSAAISNFERATGMPVDGAPSPPLLARLQATQ
jgi:Putative peptidoglycan binding domain